MCTIEDSKATPAQWELNLRFLFGGKGGVGKTTISAAFATLLARRGTTLLVSLDPAHSLSDIFEQPIGPEQVPLHMPDVPPGRLLALEVDPAQALESYKRKTLERIRDMELDLDFDMEKYVETVGLSPGAEESAMFEQFLKHLGRQDVAHVVFDTAPTAATLRLFQLADQIDDWLEVMLNTRRQIGRLQRMLDRTQQEDPLVNELRSLQADVQRCESLLRSEETKIILVTEAGRLQLRETERAEATLRQFGLTPAGIVINRVADPAAAPALARLQAPWLGALRQRWGELVLAEVGLCTTEPTGPNLEQVASQLEKSRLAEWIA